MPPLKILFCGFLFLVASIEAKLNNRPIIGVLLQEEGDQQYVASSYVKWVEMAGARVVPIFINRDQAYYSHLLDHINGVLLPGGNVSLLDSGYAKASDIILDLSIAKYQHGIHFPVFAICNGFEKLITYFTGNTNLDWESMCYINKVSLPLDFPPDMTPKTIRMLRKASRIYKILRRHNVTVNYHDICLSVAEFQKNRNLTEHFKLVSTNTFNGHHFVSTIEHREYPIYSTQWHPEKNQFEWASDVNHDFYGVLVGQHFANFFVNEARRNGQRFASADEEAELMIYRDSHRLRYSGNVAGKAKSDKLFDKFVEVYLWPV